MSTESQPEGQRLTSLRGVDVNLIVAMDAIFSELNLTRAGERVGIGQSTMSGILARLRRHFDDELLVRTGRYYELSPLAERLRPFVTAAMVEIVRTLEKSQVFEPAESSRQFFVSASDYALSLLTAPLLATVRAQAPHVQIAFDPIPADPSLLATHLVRRDLIIVGADVGVPCRSTTLFEDRLVVVVDHANPRLRGTRLGVDDLAELSHVVGRVGPADITVAHLMLSTVGVTPRVVMTAPGLLSVPFLVAGSDYVGLVPERLARSCADALGLVVVETPLAALTLVESVYWQPTDVADPGLHWLLGILKQAAAELGPVSQATGHALGDTP